MGNRLILTFAFMASSFANADVAYFNGYALGERPGLEAGVGYIARFEYGSLTLNPLSVVMWNKETDTRYREEQQADGTWQCINTRNYQPADRDSCSSKMNVMYAPSAEATFQASEFLQIGLGYRGGDRPNPYGIFNFYFGNSMYLALHASENYQSLSYGFRF